MNGLVELREYTKVTKASRIDEEAGILYDLALLGERSANGRRYPASTMQSALHLFEGRQSFLNHGRDADVDRVLGVWKECRVEGGKVRGNFHYFKSHPFAPRLVEAARRPELNNALGFSISGRGRTRTEDGETVVEELSDLGSIDCVAQPATVAGLYEGLIPVSPTRRKKRRIMRVREVIEATRYSRPGYSRALREFAEAGLMSPDAEMDEPGAASAGSEGADHKQALKDAAKACIDDDSLSDEEKVAKIKAIFALLKGKGGSSKADDTRTSKEQESRRYGRGYNLTERRVSPTDDDRKARVGRLRSVR